MAENYIPIPTLTTGTYNVRTNDRVIGANTVQEHVYIPIDQVTGSAIAAQATAPTAGNLGMIVRAVVYSTDSTAVIPVSGTVSLSGLVGVKNSDSTDNSLNTGGQIAQKVHIVGDGNKFVGGIDAHDAAITGNPVLEGGVGSTAAPAAVTAGRVARNWNDLNGRRQITGDSSMSPIHVTGTLRTSGIFGGYVATANSAVPTMVAYVGGRDSVNIIPFMAISTASVASALTQTRGVLAAMPLVQWVRAASAAANARCSVSKTATTGAYNVIVGYSWSQGCGTASSTNDSVNVLHGPTGTAVVFAQHSARCAASDAQHYVANNLGWVASLFTAVGVEFSASAPASGFQFASIWGYTLPS